ncbi:MAG: hypothetical protein ACP5TE_14375, partial [Verrucomicrobiia bacterium]
GQSTVPTGLSNVVAIAAGEGHSLALVQLPPSGTVLLREPRWTAQGFEALVCVPGSGSYRVERSVDLLNWQPLFTTNAPGHFKLLDPDARNTPRRFYRALSL